MILRRRWMAACVSAVAGVAARRLHAAAPRRVRVIHAARGDEATSAARFAAGEAAHTAKLLGAAFEISFASGGSADEIAADARRKRDRDTVAIVGGLDRASRVALARLGLVVLATPEEPAARDEAAPNVFLVGSTVESRRRALARRDLAPGAVVADWHPALVRNGAAQLNQRYRQATGAEMTALAWTTWVAVKAVAEAALRTPEGRAPFAQALGRLRFDGHKGTALYFDAGRCLVQPVYLVRGNAVEAEWSPEDGR